MNDVCGVVIGLVRSVEDPGGMGRIQVGFPWLSGDYRSAWARVAAPLAGPKRGAFFMPEVGDEVLVGFEFGNVDHPYVLGCLWNGQDVPPEQDPQNRVIVTPGGHQLRFEDTAGARKIVLKTLGGCLLEFDDTPVGGAVTLTGGGRSIRIENGQLAIT